MDFYGQHDVKFNGEWQCVITPKDPKAPILRKNFSVEIASDEKSVEEKYLEHAVVANLRIKTDANGQTRAHFDASKCDAATHFQMIVVWTESSTESKPRLPRIPCKCVAGDETNRCSDELAHYTTSALKLEQPLLVGIVPLWESRTLRAPGARFYTANSGIVTIRSGGVKELTKKLSSSTVALLPYKIPDSKATCRVKDLTITRETPNPNQIKVTWLKPDIETTVGYYINKYAIRLRSVLRF